MQTIDILKELDIIPIDKEKEILIRQKQERLTKDFEVLDEELRKLERDIYTYELRLRNSREEKTTIQNKRSDCNYKLLLINEILNS